VLAPQTDAVKLAYDNIDKAFKANDFYEALRILLQQRTMWNGTWTKASNGKWNISPSLPPRANLGTAGFAYDIWPWS
jgi:hypothetical protein